MHGSVINLTKAGLSARAKQQRPCLKAGERVPQYISTQSPWSLSLPLVIIISLLGFFEGRDGFVTINEKVFSNFSNYLKTAPSSNIEICFKRVS